jgi:hypothetical protein
MHVALIGIFNRSLSISSGNKFEELLTKIKDLQDNLSLNNRIKCIETEMLSGV